MRKSFQAAGGRNMFDDSDTDKRTYVEYCADQYVLGLSKNATYKIADLEFAFKAGYTCALNKPKGENNG